MFSDDKQAVEAVRSEYEAKMKQPYAEIGRLTTQIDWQKRGLLS